MGLPNEVNSALIGAAAAGDYTIDQSLRFDGSAYMVRGETGGGGNRKIHTHSHWIKRSKLSSDQVTFSWMDEGSRQFRFTWGPDDRLQMYCQALSGPYAEIYTENQMRDTNGWYHLVVAIDTTQSTATDRMKLWVNGEQIIGDLLYYRTNFDQNVDTAVDGTSRGPALGARSGSEDMKWNGYIAEVHYVNGSALTAEDFGRYDSNGVWVAKKYTGSHGTTGFYLDFSNLSDLGEDQSGNGEDWGSATNFTTSGTGTDVMSDTPTTNWCTLNPLDSEQNLSEGNLTCGSSNSHEATRATFGMTTGKWYWEGDAGSGWSNSPAIGIMTPNAILSDQLDATGGRWYRFNGDRWYDGSNGSYGTAVSSGSASVIGMAYDGDNGNLTVYVDGVSQGTAFTGLKSGQTPNLGSSTSDIWLPATKTYDGSFNVNFGQREFLYPPGTYSATSYFNTVLYTGNNSTNAITGVGFAPDFVWIKPRNFNDHHRLNDTVRGVNKTLSSNTNVSEYGPSNAYLDSFDSDGFTISGTDAGWNNSSYNYVAWCWKAGGTPSSNTDGSITASVSANQTAGFSIVTYTGTGSNATVGHGLGVAPELMFIKSRSNSTEWIAYHSGIGPTKFMNLDGYGAAATNSSVFNNTAPTSTTFTVGTVDAINYSSYTYVAYCFAEKAGISKFGTYTGNGSVDGPLISDLGFAPALVVIKRTDGSSEWAVYDSARGNDTQLRWDQIDSDNTNSAVNVRLTSSGFKIATSDPAQNASGGTYVYMAWARNYSADDTYKALNTANLPAPEIKDGSKYFNTVLWSGDGTSNRAFTNVLDFQPNFSWVKSRSNAENHVLQDSVRGLTGTNGLQLNSNNTNTEGDNGNGDVGAYTSSGFTLSDGTSGSYPRSGVNRSGYTYAGWFWKAGTASGSSNTDGSITSTVSVNQTSGFSIVTYTSPNNTADQTVGHGLGVKPNFIIVKNRDYTYNWDIYHSSLGYNSSLIFTTSGTRSGAFGAEPTSTVFTTKTSYTHRNTDDYVAYCFADVEGYSKFGSYTGNGSDNGVFIYLGFKPKWLLLKSAINTADDWVLMDVERSPANVMNDHIVPQQSSSEVSNSTETNMDFLSNGIKLRDSNGKINASGSTYVYAAFAEHPFGGSTVSPATAY